ncbi:hypothetical protein SLS62_002410 [Diatrype stigma]|uniref:Uncharacterized protein n=1 Tax=Diatrype stigma TaxID=117547 RepID=A0AAN9YVL4_9PEZI
MLQLTGYPSQPFFPNIRVLSLSQVPLVAAMASAINFHTLRSLTLRKCLGWDHFLKGILERKGPINLKTLEIQYDDEGMGLEEYVIGSFLDAFEGLEELFVSMPGPHDSIRFWNHLAHHRETLRKLADHQRTVNTDEDSPAFERDEDVPDLGIFGRQLRRIKKDPSQNPLARLDLECLGLPCLPECLKPILQPFAEKASLKLLHIRQSCSDLEHLLSWAQEGNPQDLIDISDESEPESNSEGSGPASEAESDPSEPSVREGDTEQVGASVRLRKEFRQFIEWAFGPQGVSSLQIVAYGDFAYGGRDPYQNIVLCRSSDERMHYRILSPYEAMAVLEEHRAMLEALPMAPILYGKWLN